MIVGSFVIRVPSFIPIHILSNGYFWLLLYTTFMSLTVVERLGPQFAALNRGINVINVRYAVRITNYSIHRATVHIGWCPEYKKWWKITLHSYSVGHYTDTSIQVHAYVRWLVLICLYVARTFRDVYKSEIQSLPKLSLPLRGGEGRERGEGDYFYTFYIHDWDWNISWIYDYAEASEVY